MSWPGPLCTGPLRTMSPFFSKFIRPSFTSVSTRKPGGSSIFSYSISFSSPSWSADSLRDYVYVMILLLSIMDPHGGRLPLHPSFAQGTAAALRYVFCRILRTSLLFAPKGHLVCGHRYTANVFLMHGSVFVVLFWKARWFGLSMVVSASQGTSSFRKFDPLSRCLGEG